MMDILWMDEAGGQDASSPGRALFVLTKLRANPQKTSFSETSSYIHTLTPSSPLSLRANSFRQGSALHRQIFCYELVILTSLDINYVNHTVLSAEFNALCCSSFKEYRLSQRKNVL